MSSRKYTTIIVATQKFLGYKEVIGNKFCTFADIIQIYSLKINIRNNERTNSFLGVFGNKLPLSCRENLQKFRLSSWADEYSALC